MIVKCENCQTRFRIPDEKVTEKGVKVRCTKCSHTFRVSKAPSAEAAAAPPADPFAQFAPAPEPPADESTRPGIYVPGIVASRSPQPSSPPPRPQSSAPADLSDLFGSPPDPTAPAVPSPPVASRRGDAPTGSAGEDFSSVFSEPTRVAPAPAPPAARSSAAQKSAANLSRAVSSAPAPVPQSSAAFELDMGGPPSLADAPPGPTMPAPAAPPEADPFAADPSSLLGDVPPPSDDLFGGLTGPNAQLTTSGSMPMDFSAPASGPDRGLFELPPQQSDAGHSAGESPFGTAQEAASPAPAEPEVVPAATVAKPVGRPEDARGLDETRKRGTARRLSGVVANVSIAAALVLVVITIGSVYLNEGKLDASSLSVERAKQLLMPAREIVARDLSNGLYDTQQGRPVFFVRGEVENRGDKPGRARVRAEILDGDTLVRAAEGFAGAVPTPEELYTVSSVDDVASLTARLDRGAKVIAPGERVSFVVTFFEYPPDLAAYRLRVTVLPETGASASR